MTETSHDTHPPHRAIKGAIALPPWHLLLLYEGPDGGADEYRIVSLKHLLERTERAVEPLRDWAFFREVTVMEKTVMWPNGLDLDAGWLYVDGAPVSRETLDSITALAEDKLWGDVP